MTKIEKSKKTLATLLAPGLADVKHIKRDSCVGTLRSNIHTDIEKKIDEALF
jgi:hypothetical protein